MTFFAHMLMLRNRRLQRMMTLFTGIVFLNMSFFLFEVSLLKLDKDHKMIENIAKLIAGAASEEEKDVFGSSSEKDNLTTNALDLFLDPNHCPVFFLIPLSKSTGIHFDEKPIVQYAEIASPPPKV